jgi:PAS domain S-box-containing protein
MKILVVEDNAFTNQVLEKYLVDLGFDVLTASNSRQGWEIFCREDIHFVITDWMMPEVNGLELIRKIRENNEKTYCYIILLTSKNTQTEIVKGISCGADDYIAKPFHKEELAVRVRAGQRVTELQEELLKTNEQLKVELEERIMMTEILHENEQQLRTLIASIPGAVYRFRIDSEWTIEFISDVIEDITAYPASKFRWNPVQTYRDIIYPADKEKVEKAILEAMELMESLHVEYRIIDANGHLRWLIETGRTVHSTDGVPLWFDGTIIDYTDRKSTGEVLRESEIRFRELFNRMSSGVAVYEAKDNGREFIFRDINRPGERISQVSRDQVVGKSIRQVFPGVEDFGLFEVFQQVWRTGEAQHHPAAKYEDERISSWVENYVYKLPSGEIVAVYDDITDRKHAEETILGAKQEWERTFDAVPDLIAILDDKFRIVKTNKAMSDTLGLSPDEAVGLLCYENIHGTTEPPPFCPHAKLLLDGQAHTVEIHEEGLGGDFFVSVSPRYDSKGRLIGSVHVAHDITAKKQAEAELQKTLDELEQKVYKRTQELSMSNAKMHYEIEERKVVEEFLNKKEEELKHQADHLEKTNMALKVLLDHRDEERTRLKDGILLNVKKLVMPYLDKLDMFLPNDHAKTYLNIIKTNLETLVSPFTNNLSSKHLNLTPTEMQVADFVRNGFANKEIASHLNVSIDAVSFHRKNIRKKLGLIKRKTNLRSYLQRLSD